jgi:3-oxoacyl-[acyl-carrier protein] reductase
MVQKRTFIVTGGTKGIGLATAHRLIDEGHRVIAMARSRSNLSNKAEFVSVDFADSESTDQVLKSLVSRFEIDGVVNNVGLVKVSSLEQVTNEDFFAAMDLNVRSAIQVTQSILTGMKARKWGRVVNITSLTTLGIANRSSYAASKAALLSLTRTWALELATAGITVNAVSPGPTETELFRQNNPAGSEAEKKYIDFVPMGRLGQPEEIASSIRFLLSNDAAFITGQTLWVDGGASIGRLSS